MQAHLKAILSFFSRQFFVKQAMSLFFLGGLTALCFAPFHWFFILILTLPMFAVIVFQVQTPKQAFWQAWVFFVGYFVAGLYWIAWALFTDIAQYWWALPLAVFGLPVLLAVFQALPMMFLHKIRQAPTVIKMIAFASAWLIGELARGYLFTGFPWNLLGYTWSTDAFLPILQSVQLWTIYGLSFVTLLLFCAPMLWLLETKKNHRALYTVFCVSLAVGVLLFGYDRLDQSVPEETRTIRLVQPNIPQVEKWDYGFAHRNLKRLIELSVDEESQGVDMIIWPETALGLWRQTDRDAFQKMVSDILVRSDQVLLTGVLEPDRVNDKDVLRNNLVAFGYQGKRLHSYAKSHLVPFGEYLPFEEYWPVDPIAGGGAMFAPGQGVQTLELPALGINFSPLVCYEVIFPHAVVDHQNRPNLMVNVTNDAWYGYTSGPFQHLAIARVRAIEEGIPLIRVANTGISAAIDAQGRILGKIALEHQGFLDIAVPISVTAQKP